MDPSAPEINHPQSAEIAAVKMTLQHHPKSFHIDAPSARRFLATYADFRRWGNLRLILRRGDATQTV
jgi:hypothetical protein